MLVGKTGKEHGEFFLLIDEVRPTRALTTELIGPVLCINRRVDLPPNSAENNSFEC